jgi:hypothetical protein
LVRYVFCIFLLVATALFGKNPKTLVIILGETRAHELTYENIKKNLIDELGVDLAVCIGVKEDYCWDNPFYKNAKYRFTYQEPADYGSLFDAAYEQIVKTRSSSSSPPMHWREFLKIPDQFLGGIQDSQHQHPGSAGILVFCRWFLLTHLLEHNLLDRYDFFIITRSDYIYKLPHPKIHLFSPDKIYIPDGERYGGVTDRHVVLPKKWVISYLNILQQMVSEGESYYKELEKWQPVNLEKLIQFHLTRQGAFPHVRFFPYVMYTIRPQGGSTRWAQGFYSEAHGYFIKYPGEYQSAEMHQKKFKKERCDIDTFYRKRIDS